MNGSNTRPTVELARIKSIQLEKNQRRFELWMMLQGRLAGVWIQMFGQALAERLDSICFEWGNRRAAKV